MTLFSLIIIGDEILSGHRTDKHFSHILSVFKQKGLRLSQVYYVNDDRERIASLMRYVLSTHDIIISCGGIGATPDDHTRQAVAQALGVDLVLHPQAKTCITQVCFSKGELDMQTEQNQFRLNMGRFPVGADIIPNDYNGIPGFSINQRLYCLPGFPIMAWPMLDWILNTHYSHLFDSQIPISQAIQVFDLPESALIGLMQQIELDYAPIKIYSLPSIDHSKNPAHTPYIELGCKAMATDSKKLIQAMSVIQEKVQQLGGTIIPIMPVEIHKAAVIAG